MPAELILVATAPFLPRACLLEVGRTYTVGRFMTCDIRVPHLSMSRSHARIEVLHDRLLVADLGSCNGTFIDKERVERCEVPIGGKFRLGRCEFILATTDEQPDEPDDDVSYVDTDNEDDLPLAEDLVPSPSPAHLSPQRKEALALLLAGLGEKAIAGRLQVRKCTAHKHITAIYRLFKVHSRAELLALHLKVNRHNGNGDGPPAGSETLK
jgi:pSer/pThr/pTyr-binding forkhead associated (FHA) protein